MPAKTRQSVKIDLETLNQLPVSIALFDNNRVYFVNKKAAKLFKISPAQQKEIQKYSIFSFLDKSHHKRIKSNNTKILKGEIFPPIELEFVDFKGKTLYVEASSNLTFFNGKKVIQSTFTEISERKKTEELLNDTKQKFELITNNANDIISFYTYFPIEGYLYVSPNIQKILGYKPEELIKEKNFFNKRVLENKDPFIKIDSYLRNLQKKNICKNYSYIFKTRKKNQEEVWLENSLVPITDSNNKIRFFLNILRDITEHKEKEIELSSQQINYQNLLDNSQVAYVIHHHGIVKYCNKELLKLLKLKEKKQILGKFAADFFAVPDRKRAITRIKDVYQKKKLNEPYTYRLVDSKGMNIEVEIKSNLINYNNEICILSSIYNISQQRQLEREMLRAEISELNNRLLQKEIVEKQKVELNLIEKTAQLSSILESSNHLIWSVNKTNQIVSFNKNFQNVILEKYNLNLKVGMRIDEHLKSGRTAYTDFWYTKYALAFEGQKLEFERQENEGAISKIFRKIFINPIYNPAGLVTEISCIAHDITEAKIYEQKLFNQAAKLNSIFDSSNHYIWTIDRTQKLTSFNKNYFDLISSLYDTQPYIGLVLNRGILSNNKEYNDLLKYYYQKAFDGESVNFEIETVDKTFNKIYLDIFLNPIFDNNKVLEVSGIAHDVTEKKISQQRMEQSLKEKEILLKEVHHRVKNNMQVISSILNLQSSYVSDDYALSLLKESQNRIKTMAYIHESLYQNKSFTSVNFSDYISTLTNNIIQSYAVSEEKVQLILSLEKINLNLDNSIPTGLIVNELITNAIKHAFPGNMKGFINVNLKSENNTVYLEVKDDGVGFDSDLDFRNTNSLGLQLVSTLIDQIEGELNFKSEKNKGTKVLITFKM